MRAKLSGARKHSPSYFEHAALPRPTLMCLCRASSGPLLFPQPKYWYGFQPFVYPSCPWYLAQEHAQKVKKKLELDERKLRNAQQKAAALRQSHNHTFVLSLLEVMGPASLVIMWYLYASHVPRHYVLHVSYFRAGNPLSEQVEHVINFQSR